LLFLFLFWSSNNCLFLVNLVGIQIGVMLRHTWWAHHFVVWIHDFLFFSIVQ
jgi:hypothetical protein